MKKYLKQRGALLLLHTLLILIFTACIGSNSSNPILKPNLVHADDGPEQNPYRIEFDETNVDFTYGVYRELEIHLNGGTIDKDIVWQNIEGDLPPGLVLENSNTTTIRLFGAGEFEDRWCFVLSTSNTNNTLVSREICVNGIENKELDYPRFKKRAVLPNGEVTKVYRERIKYVAKKKYTYSGEILQSQISKGMKVTFEKKNNRFLVAGTPKEDGVYRFSIVLADQLGHQVSKQYQFEVLPKVEPPPPDEPPPVDVIPEPEPQPQPIYQCPPGYYYNPTLGYCVEDRAASCPPGSYYDPYKGSCEHYRTEPTCGYDEYYDYFLERCVQKEYPRCPWNYEYSYYYGRCIRLSYTCSFGYEYDWNSRECRRSWNSRNCHYDSYWDYLLGRCEPYWKGCHAGYRWDHNSHNCVRRSVECRRGEYYDPSYGQCVKRNEYCEPGTRYDYRSGRCEYFDHEGRCPRGQHWDFHKKSCESDNQHNPPPPRPPCEDAVQSPVACAQYAGQYGIPNNATQGMANWTKNTCTAAIKYTGGCSVPANNVCREENQTPVACSQYAGQYGIPNNATQGHARWSKNSCSGEIKYLGGCSVPGRPVDPNPQCKDERQTPVACADYAGQYGIPANATEGRASWTKNSCTGDIKYTGGCSVPRATCKDEPQSPVSCADYAGQYGIPSNATEGRASWTKNSCTGDIRYTGGCSIPRPTCRDEPQSPVSCADYAGQYGIPSNATEGRASWTKNSCTGDIRYTGGCSIPRPTCRDEPQSPVSCADYAGQYGIPAGATRGSASWTKNSCTGEIRYTGGCH